MANPTGKGGFQERPQDINREGAPTKDRSWRGSIRRLTNMTRDELIEYFGPKTKMGKMLKELPPNVPLKDALLAIGFIQYGRDPSPSWLNMFADREEGKPNQPITGEMTFSWKEFINGDDPESSDK